MANRTLKRVIAERLKLQAHEDERQDRLSLETPTRRRSRRYKDQILFIARPAPDRFNLLI
jgi:hypothetical protein